MRVNDNIHHDSLSYHDANIDHINTILLPLKKYFFIDSFMYIELFKDKVFFLSNEKETMRKVIECKRFSDSFYNIVKHSPLNTNQLFVWPPNSKDHMNLLLREHNMNNGITIMKKMANSVKTYGFVSRKAELNLGEWHTNHPEIVSHFINYFNSSFNNILKEKQKHLIDFKSPAEYLANKNLEQYAQNKARFIEETKIKRIYLSQKEDVYLTNRECECLNLFLRGKSYKEVACELNISHRTVATHLETIRYKTNLYSKKNLTSFFDKEKDIFCG